MNKTISIPEWLDLAQEDTKIPIRIPLLGWSMVPLIRYKRDYVTIMPLDRKPQVGDIILFSAPVGEKYIVHRIWKMKDQEVLTWGDNCISPDGWLQIDNVLGKVVLIERGRRKIKPNPAKGILWARIWHQAGKLYRPYIKYKYKLKDSIEKLGTWGKK